MGAGQEQVCLRPARSVWSLDFVQERFPTTSPGDFERAFIKAGDSETKDVLSIEAATGDSLGCAVLWPPRNVIRKK